MADASAPLSTSADVNLIQSFPLEIPKSESSVLPFECERNLNSVPAPGEIIRIFVGHPSTPGVAYPAHVTVGASMEDLVKELQHECPSLSTMSAIYIFPYYSRLTDSKYLKHDDRIWFCEYDFQVPPENGAFLSNEPQKKKRRRSKSSISIAHKLFEIVTDYNIAISRQSKYDVRRIAWGAKHIPNFLFDHKRCSDGVKAASEALNKVVLHESSTGQSTTSLCDAIIAEMISDPLPWLDLCVKAAEHHGHKDLRIRMSRFHSSGLLQTNSGSITLGRLNINSRLGMEGISQGSFHSLISPIVQNDIQRDWVNSRIMTTQSNTIPVSLPAVLMTQSNTTNSMKNSDELSDEESKRLHLETEKSSDGT